MFVLCNVGTSRVLTEQTSQRESVAPAVNVSYLQAGAVYWLLTANVNSLVFL